MKQITCWQTTDNKIHESEEWAKYHQAKLDQAEKATALLRDGKTIAECLRAVGCKGEIDPVLERVTKDTKLVISYWQCRDTPGYKPTHFTPGLSVHCWGDAGSWSGAYGGDVKLQELARYANDKRTEFAEQANC